LHERTVKLSKVKQHETKKLGYCLVVCIGMQNRVLFYKRVPYSQRYLFITNPDPNHNANPTNPNGNSNQ